MTEILQTIRQLAKQTAPEAISIRRHLHANPELSYEEFETSAFVKGKLETMGLSPVVMAKTGLTA
ncbi:MAG: amidohydrolase, partial [Sphingobacteriales bacterium]